ncbi:MAG: GumC family protein, partial [Candidatus Eisenbacteria bacterium]
KTSEIPSIAPHRPERQASAREFLAVVFRRKWVIAGLYVIETLTVGIITLTSPTRYRSIGKVLVNRGEKESLMIPQRRITNWEEELASEVQFIESEPVAARAQRMLDEAAAHGGRKLVLNPAQVDAEVVGQSNAVLIAYVDLDPAVARTACDAVMRAYVATRNETYDLPYPVAFFDREMREVTDEMTRLERARRDYTEGNHAVALEEQQREQVAYVIRLDQQRNDVLTDLATAQAQYEQLERFASDPNHDPPTTGEFGEQVLTEIKVQVMKQEARVAQLREKYRDDSPDVVNAQATLDALHEMVRQEVAARVDLAKGRVQTLQAKLKPIDAEIARVRGEIALTPQKQMSLSEMDRQIQVLHDRYTQLVTFGDQARITQEMSKTVTVLVLAPAAKARPTNTRDYVRLGLAPAFSLVVGLGLAFFIDGLDTRVHTPVDAETAADLPVLASIGEHRRRRRDETEAGREAATR